MTPTKQPPGLPARFTQHSQMAVSFNILEALFFLLPGILYQAWYARNKIVVASTQSQGTNSIALLAWAPLVALLTHATWALMFWINSCIASQIVLFDIGFDPNPYLVTSALSAPSSISLPENDPSFFVFYNTLFILLISASPIISVEVFSWLRSKLPKSKKTSSEKEPNENWLEHLVKQIKQPKKNGDEGKYILGTVVTKNMVDGFLLAHQGVLEKVSFDNTGKINQVILDLCLPILISNSGEKIAILDRSVDRFVHFSSENINWCHFELTHSPGASTTADEDESPPEPEKNSESLVVTRTTSLRNRVPVKRKKYRTVATN